MKRNPEPMSGYLDGTGNSHHAARADHTHNAANQAASTATSAAALKNDFNDLLCKLKNAGIMTPDVFTMAYSAVTDSVEGHADRQFNTNKISSVSIDNDEHVITISLSEKVAALKDFDGGNGWGKHKWLGIGLGVSISPVTGLYYNGSAMTSDDVTEATVCDLSAGYFVRWVAADLVLAGDNSQRSKNTFTLWADGYAETEYTLKIVEPV